MEEKLDEILFKLEESAQALGSPPSEGGKTYLVGPDRWAAGRPAETVFFLKGYLIFFKITYLVRNGVHKQNVFENIGLR